MRAPCRVSPQTGTWLVYCCYSCTCSSHMQKEEHVLGAPKPSVTEGPGNSTYYFLNHKALAGLKKAMDPLLQRVHIHTIFVYHLKDFVAWLKLTFHNPWPKIFVPQGSGPMQSASIEEHVAVCRAAPHWPCGLGQISYPLCFSWSSM